MSTPSTSSDLAAATTGGGLARVETIDIPSVRVEAIDLPSIERGLCGISPEMDADTVMSVIDKIDVLDAMLKELKRSRDERLTEWIEANGELRSGPWKWYIGAEKETECINRTLTLEKCYEAAGGDFEAVQRDFLGANAFKHGSIKKAIGADFEKCFKVSVKKDLKNNGAEVRKLQKVNTDFVK